MSKPLYLLVRDAQRAATSAFYRTRLGQWWDDALLRARLQLVDVRFPEGSLAWKEAMISAHVLSRKGRNKLAVAMLSCLVNPPPAPAD